MVVLLDKIVEPTKVGQEVGLLRVNFDERAEALKLPLVRGDVFDELGEAGRARTFGSQVIPVVAVDESATNDLK